MKLVKNTFKNKLVEFSIYCRERQFIVSPQQTEEAFQISTRGFLLNRKIFHTGLKAIYCKRKEHFERFDELFIRFWSRNYKEELEKRKVKTNVKDNNKSESSLIFLGTNFGNNNNLKEEKAKKTVGANKNNRLRYTDFTKLKIQDKDELENLAEELFYQMSLRLKRRMAKSKIGKIDIHNTIRKSISKGGWMIDLVKKSKTLEKRRIVFLLDISGSMDTYSFYLLQYVLILKKYFKSLEFFTFSTELTHITPMLKLNNKNQILKVISNNLRNWSSGTKIGESLSEFLNVYGKKFLSQKNVVVILSDGLETGSVNLLRESVRTLKRKCKTLIWLNPLKGSEGYQPIQKGIVNAMPHLDSFESAHNLNSLLKLEKLLVNV